MTTAYLSLGCNLGDCRANLAAAIRMLGETEGIEVTKISSVYATEPVGNPEQPDFLNIATELDTALNPQGLHGVCRIIERELGGREGRVPLGPRTIDIDVLLYGQSEISDGELTVPHPRMLERAFVLVPLAEIAPDSILPRGGTIIEALRALSDPHSVEKQDKLDLNSSGNTEEEAELG